MNCIGELNSVLRKNDRRDRDRDRGCVPVADDSVALVDDGEGYLIRFFDDYFGEATMGDSEST